MSYDRLTSEADCQAVRQAAAKAEIEALLAEHDKEHDIPPLRTPLPPNDARNVPDPDYNPNKAERPSFPPPF